MVITNGGNVQAITKLSDINHNWEAESTVLNIYDFKMHTIHFLFA